jgi:putative IMPACT (imprinted ancient) family translation regulator
VTDTGSVFKGYAAGITHEQDVALVLEQCLELEGFATSTHRIVAYGYQHGNNMVENFDSDGDDGVGRKMLRAMQEKNITDQIWIATRTCLPNFAHIGNRRFTHAISVCQAASTNLSDT